MRKKVKHRVCKIYSNIQLKAEPSNHLKYLRQAFNAGQIVKCLMILCILTRIKQNTHIEFSFKFINFCQLTGSDSSVEILSTAFTHKKICNCVGDSYACTVLTMTWMVCQRCCTGEFSPPDASRSCAWLTPSPGRCSASPNRLSSSPQHASPPHLPYWPGHLDLQH